MWWVVYYAKNEILMRNECVESDSISEAEAIFNKTHGEHTRIISITEALKEDVSIIVNKTRYDAVMGNGKMFDCEGCELDEWCTKIGETFSQACISVIGEYGIFVKSNKKFDI